MFFPFGWKCDPYLCNLQPRRLSRNAATIFYEDRLIPRGPWVVEWGIHETSGCFSGIDTKMWALLRSQGANSVFCRLILSWRFVGRDLEVITNFLVVMIRMKQLFYRVLVLVNLSQWPKCLSHPVAVGTSTLFSYDSAYIVYCCRSSLRLGDVEMWVENLTGNFHNSSYLSTFRTGWVIYSPEN